MTRPEEVKDDHELLEARKEALEESAGDLEPEPELSLESKVMIQLHRKQSETLQSHMARQNMMVDALILEMRKANVALELMLGDTQKFVYEGSCKQLIRTHNEKVARVREQIEATRAARADPPVQD